MTGITAIMCGMGGATSATYNPVPGTYTVTDNGPGGIDATWTVTASTSVTWTTSMTGNTGFITVKDQTGTAFSNGGSATSLTFYLTAAATTANRTVVVTLTSGANTWTITLNATGQGGGAVMTL